MAESIAASRGRSFLCRVRVQDGEAYVCEPALLLHRFFGTTAADWQGGVLHRLRETGNTAGASRLGGLLRDKAVRQEDFQLDYLSARAGGVACTVQLDAYAVGGSAACPEYQIVGTDISRLAEQEQQLTDQYNTAQAFLDSVSDRYIAAQRVNLTRNLVEHVRGAEPLEPVKDCLDYEASVAALLSALPKERDRRACGDFFSREHLLQAYAAGQRTLTVEYQFQAGADHIRWARAQVTLSKHPGSGDVIMFDAVSDITREKMVSFLVNRIAMKQYDYMACIYARRNAMDIIVNERPQTDLRGIRDTADYEATMRAYAAKYIVPAERESCVAMMTLPHVLQKLEQQGHYEIAVTIQADGMLRNKRLEYSFIDPETQLIALTRTDFTEVQKKQMAQEKVLRTALAAAQQASAAKSEFLSRMSHDIRTPLNGIIGMTYLAKQAPNPPDTVSCLANIETSSKFLLGLINDILDMAKAESNKLELHAEPYLLEEFQDYIDAVVRPLCVSKNQKLVFAPQVLDDRVPLIDKLRINQIVFNLLSNAVKYTPEGGTIRYMMRETLAPGGLIAMHIEISDTGIGMSEAFQKVLFEPFSQEGRNDVSESRGSGLGLAIAKKMMDLMGGRISVQSQLGQGTTFSLELMLESIPREEAARREQAAAAQLPQDYTALAGKHVLICEDHPLNQEIVRRMLEEKAMQSEIAENGREGVKLFNQSPLGFYDAVLMDIRMPIMDGYEATRAIRSLEREDGRQVPIIAMTADAFADDVKKCLATGMNGHIAKPIEPEKMFAIILRCMCGRHR